MLGLFAYPVSGVMKLWHLMLTGIVGMDPVVAWTWSIVGLVVTVRALLLPLSWFQKRSVHRSALMGPELVRLQMRYGGSTDPAAIAALTAEQKALRKRNNASFSAGCLPVFVQIPVLMGLYRLLMWMSRPELLPQHTGPHGGLGFLSAQDVASFAHARFMDVPLTAYLAMSPQRMAAVGADPARTEVVITPLVLAAVVFTLCNISMSIFFTRRTMNWALAPSRWALKFSYSLLVITPLLLITMGFHGPLPLALVLYWCAGNVWSAAQVLGVNLTAWYRWPMTEEFRNYHAANRRLMKKQKATKGQMRKQEQQWIESAVARGSTEEQARRDVEQRRMKMQEASKERRQQLRARRKAVKEAKAQLKRGG